MTPSLEKIRPGEAVSANHYNQLVDALQRLQREFQRDGGATRGSTRRAQGPAWNITSAFPIEVRRHPGGVHVSLANGVGGADDAYIELTSALAFGGSATAKILAYDGAAWTDAPTSEIVVHDVVGTMDGSVGDKGLARRHRQSGLWLLWQLQC